MNVSFQLNKSAFHPGEEIHGTVTWNIDRTPKKAELRLFWHTKGKGDRDFATAASETFEIPLPAETRSFTFQAPDFPYSFSGELISLIWGLELVMEPGGATATEVVISPTGHEIVLHGPDSPAPDEKKAFRRFQ